MIGDYMKKIIIKSIIWIIIGFILGEILFCKKDILKYLQGKEIYYFIEEGTYKDLNSLKKNLNNLSQKIVDYKDNNYDVDVGITKDKEIAKKLKEIY